MLDITIEKEEKYSVIHLDGEVDASNSVVLDQTIQNLLAENVGNILVDGSDLKYISSAGLGVFMSYLEDFKEKGVAFIIFGLEEKVLNVFHILGLDQLIIMENSQKDALARLYEA